MLPPSHCTAMHVHHIFSQHLISCSTRWCEVCRRFIVRATHAPPQIPRVLAYEITQREIISKKSSSVFPIQHFSAPVPRGPSNLSAGANNYPWFERIDSAWQHMVRNFRPCKSLKAKSLQRNRKHQSSSDNTITWGRVKKIRIFGLLCIMMDQSLVIRGLDLSVA